MQCSTVLFQYSCGLYILPCRIRFLCSFAPKQEFVNSELWLDKEAPPDTRSASDIVNPHTFGDFSEQRYTASRRLEWRATQKT